MKEPHETDGSAVALQDLLLHRSWVRGFCRSLVGTDDGDDLAQDTWLVALRRPAARIARPRPWLASVARRLAWDRGRATARRARREDAAGRDGALVSDAGEAAETVDLVQRSELAHIVAGEVLALAEPYRSTLLLRFFEGLDSTAIGVRLGVSPSTVRSRIRRGLRDVRQALDQRHGGERSRWLAALAPLAVPQSAARSALVPAALLSAAAAGALAGLWWSGGDVQSSAALGTRSASAPEESTAVAALAGASGAPAGSAGAQDRTPVPDRDPTPARGLVAPRVAWHYPEPQSAAPLVVGQRLVSVGRDLSCLSVDDGGELWSVASDSERSRWIGPPVHHEGQLVLTHWTGGVASFALDDGRLLWSRSYEQVLGSGQPCGLGVAEDGSPLALVGTRGGVCALALEDGSIAWRTELDGQVAMRPVSDGERVLCGTNTGTFVALELETGEVLWRVRGGGEYGWTNPVLAGGVCYVGDRGKDGSRDPREAGSLVHAGEDGRGGALNAFRVDTGELLWGRIFGATGLSDPFVTETDVWAGFGTVCAPFERETGKVEKERVVRTGRNAFGTPRVLEDQLIFGNLDGHLYVHDAVEKTLLWKFSPSTEGEQRQVGGWTAAHGRLFVATTAGIFALEDERDAAPFAAGTAFTPNTEDLRVDGAGVSVVEGFEEPIRAPVFESAHEIAATWAQAIAPRDDQGRIQEQKADPVAQRKALAEVERALASEDATRVRAALLALQGCRGVEGASDLRYVVEPLARSGDAALRIDALYALFAVGPPVGGGIGDDLPLVHAAWEVVDAGNRVRIPHLCCMFGEYRVSGRSAEIVLGLLDDPTVGPFHQWINGLWGARVADPIALRLVELATDPRYETFAYDAFYYALSTLLEKQPAVVDVLLDALERPDPNWSQRALWGLGHGVPEAAQSTVAGALLERMPSLPEHHRSSVKELVRRYGTPAQIAALRE